MGWFFRPIEIQVHRLGCIGQWFSRANQKIICYGASLFCGAPIGGLASLIFNLEHTAEQHTSKPRVLGRCYYSIVLLRSSSHQTLWSTIWLLFSPTVGSNSLFILGWIIQTPNGKNKIKKNSLAKSLNVTGFCHSTVLSAFAIK